MQLAQGALQLQGADQRAEVAPSQGQAAQGHGRGHLLLLQSLPHQTILLHSQALTGLGVAVREGRQIPGVHLSHDLLIALQDLEDEVLGGQQGPFLLQREAREQATALVIALRGLLRQPGDLPRVAITVRDRDEEDVVLNSDPHSDWWRHRAARGH